MFLKKKLEVCGREQDYQKQTVKAMIIGTGTPVPTGLIGKEHLRIDLTTVGGMFMNCIARI